MIKAFEVQCGTPPEHWIVLAFAETRNKARKICVGWYDMADEYILLNARRRPDLDKYAPDAPAVYDWSNDPKGIIRESNFYGYNPDEEESE